MAMRPKVRRSLNAMPKGDSRRISAFAAGYDWQWSKPNGTADQVRDRDEDMCQHCLREGGVMAAVEEQLSRKKKEKENENDEDEFYKLIVDHIIPAHVIPRSRFHDMSNLQCLCYEHHAQKTAQDLKKYGAANR